MLLQGNMICFSASQHATLCFTLWSPQHPGSHLPQSAYSRTASVLRPDRQRDHTCETQPYNQTERFQINS